MNPERLKKIEAGRSKLAEFQKRKQKNAKKKVIVQDTSNSLSSFECPSSKPTDEKGKMSDSSSNTSIRTLKDECDFSLEEITMNFTPATESAFLMPEDENEDTGPLEAEQSALVSCLESKLNKYQESSKQKDQMIQKLSQQLASAMSTSEASDPDLMLQINDLKGQIKEATEMIAKQYSKSELKSIQGDVCENVPYVCNAGVQVDINNKNSLQEYTLNESVFSQPTNSANNNTEFTIKNELEYPSRISISKKIGSLGVITKLVESLVHSSSQSINDRTDFSPSKFQSFFLKRLNSEETSQLEASEGVSHLTDINYAETESFANTSEISVELLRNYIIPKDLSLVTDYLLQEMENINSSLHSLKAGPQGDSVICVQMSSDDQEIISGNEKLLDPEIQGVFQQKSKLECKIMHLKELDKTLQTMRYRQKSEENDTLINSDDNLIMEEPPLSCVSLLSLTDSEYRTEYITDSEATVSRKVSIDSSRPTQEFCVKCEKYFELIKDKYDDHMCLLKETIENNLIWEKNESIKKLESEIETVKLEKDTLHAEIVKQMELFNEEQELKTQQVVDELQKQLNEFQDHQNKCAIERNQLASKMKDLEEKLVQVNKELKDAWNEKANIEFSLQKEIADLVEEHQEDLEARNLAHSEQRSQERRKLESEHFSSSEVLKKLHKEEIEDLKQFYIKELENQETSLKKDYSVAIANLESNHSEECDTYQKKIEQLLEEKCELLSKTTSEYETILKNNHKSLVMLCNQLRSKLYCQKKKIVEDSCRSESSEINLSFSDALDELNKSIEEGILKFLDQNYFASNDQQELFDETKYLSLEDLKLPDFGDNCKKNDIKNIQQIDKIDASVQCEANKDITQSPQISALEDFLESEDLQIIRNETMKLQEEFQKDVAVYTEVNEQLRNKIHSLQTQNQELGEQNKKLEVLLFERDKELEAKDSQMASIDGGSVKVSLAGSQLSSSDIRSWQLDVAQTNSRLLHVLSDLVKTFLDIEQDIHRHLHEFGLVSPNSGAIGQHDDTGHSVGSREDFASLSFGECPNLELAEDGPDLTPRAWDLFSTAGAYDNEMEGEDVVLCASRKLRLAVDHLLSHLSRALDNQQNPDLKVLLKRNEELSQELQEESKGRDAAHIELVSAESTIRRLEGEKQRLEDLISDEKDNLDILKREITIERNKVTYLNQEKEAANDEIQTLKSQCELLASRLGDPEQKLLQENSRLSTEKHNVQINLNKERQSFLDRLQQMETALDDLNAEKDELMEKKCKEIRDLKAEMEAMEKQLQSNKKFIDEQAQEREQEREDYLKELYKMQEVVREKEKIQSNETQLIKEIETLEQTLRLRIEDHQKVMEKKDSIENDLRQSLDKIRDLRDVIEELEKQLNIKTKIETDLRKKLSTLSDTVCAQERRNSLLDDEIANSKIVSIENDSREEVQNLTERLAYQSQKIEELNQNQTLLHELRGQIHFLEAKVEQRAKQLENMQLLCSSPVQSADTSPGSSQESESLHLQCEDGWEMSPRTIHWLEVRRLEEKIGRLVHVDEELIKKNKELEQKFKRLQNLHKELEQENESLQEKLSDQMMKVSALKSHIDEQKHRTATPTKSQVMSKQLEKLQEDNESLMENNKLLVSELQETQSICDALQGEIAKKDYFIAELEKNAQSTLKQNVKNSEESSECFKLLLLEKEEELNSKAQMVETLQMQLLQFQSSVTDLPAMEKELKKKRKAVEVLEQENMHLKCDLEAIKNEINSLKELLNNSQEQVKIEQAEVKALREDLANISHEKKRLEEDLTLVQNMMQQKETELATLHEETDAQMKLEADIERLVKDLESQRVIETELRHALETVKNIMKQDQEQWKLKLDDLNKSHELEIKKIEKQLNLFKTQVSTVPEDIDITSIQNKIMEAINAFDLKNTNDKKEYETLIYSLLKTAVDSKLEQMQMKYELNVKEINQSWLQKIENEQRDRENLHSQCKKYKDDYLELQEKVKEVDKLSSEKDAFWETKLMDVKCLSKEIDESRFKEINQLKSNLEMLSEDKASFEMKMKNLSQQHKEALKNQKEKILHEVETRIAVIEQKQKERKTQWSKTEKTLKNQIEKLEKQLELSLKREKDCELRNKEEIASLHKLFETRWSDEMNKIMSLQMEELKKLNNNKEKNLEAVHSHLVMEYGNKLTELQKEFALQLAEERKHWELSHKARLKDLEKTLEKRFETEKRSILLSKEKELFSLADRLEKRSKEVHELQSLLQTKNGKKEWAEEKKKLIFVHNKEIAELKQDIQNKYERLLQNQLQTRDADIKRMEEAYNQPIEELTELVKIAKQTATGTNLSEISSNRTATPSSEITSSDEACSSCQEDMLFKNKHLLVDKIHQDGKRILNLVGSSDVPSPSEREAQAWLEEREYIIKKLQILQNENVLNKSTNLKLHINNLCDEIIGARNKICKLNEDVETLRKKCSKLEEEISKSNYKSYVLATNLKHQTEINADLESLLDSKSNEITEIKRTLDENLLAARDVSSRFLSQPPLNSISSLEIEQIRSADNQRSAEKFSMYQPEIGVSSNIKLNTTSKELNSDSLKSLLELTNEIMKTPNEEDYLENDMWQLKTQNSSIKKDLMALFTENGIDSSYEAKVHALYWVYKKSLSHKKSLIYQKKYLLMLLKGFQLTEKVTLSYVNRLNRNVPYDNKSTDSSMTVENPLRGRALFRSVAFVAVAIQRMKYCVSKWRLFARIPSVDIISAEVQSVFHSYHNLSPSITPREFHLSSFSLSSKSASICEETYTGLNSGASSVSSKSSKKSKKDSANRGQLIEYVQRLDNLQKQLGLDSYR